MAFIASVLVFDIIFMSTFAAILGMEEYYGLR